MIRYFHIILAFAAILSGGCATAQRGAMSRAYKAIKDGRYDAAIARLSEAEKYVTPTPALQAEIAFLRGQSYEGLKRVPDAVGCYRYLVATYPESIYAYQAEERIEALEQSEPPQAPVPTPVSAPPPAGQEARQP